MAMHVVEPLLDAIQEEAVSTTEAAATPRRHAGGRPSLRPLVEDLHERRERARLGGGRGEDRQASTRRTSSPRASGSRC